MALEVTAHQPDAQARRTARHTARTWEQRQRRQRAREDGHSTVGCLSIDRARVRARKVEQLVRVEG